MTKIKDLIAKAPVEEIILTIKTQKEAREIRGGSLRVVDAIGIDETGEVNLIVWNDDIDRIQVGNKIRISKGWVSEYQGKIQLSSGKFGKLEIIK